MDITQILVAVIGAIATIAVAVITAVIVPWVRSNTSETQQAILEAAARAAVLFVQQTFADGAASEKLSAAVSVAKEYLLNYGVSFDESTVTVEIESVLKSLKLDAGDSWK